MTQGSRKFGEADYGVLSDRRVRGVEVGEGRRDCFGSIQVVPFD